MRKLRKPRRGWAKITLGVSFLFAVGVFIYFTLIHAPLNGMVVGIFVVIAGIWEYRRKQKAEIRAERYEAKTDENRQRNR